MRLQDLSVSFTGEESARFTRFARYALAAGLRLVVSVAGREPLTSRVVHFRGQLKAAELDGYLRRMHIQELGSGLTYWVAGSNATQSIATHVVTFELQPDDRERLIEWANEAGVVIPGFARLLTSADERWVRLDAAPSRQDSPTLAFLMQQLASVDSEFKREAALVLRAYATYVTEKRATQLEVEGNLLAALDETGDTDTRIAMTEDLGYVGTERSVPVLARLLSDQGEHDHVRWAAAIALGRIPGASLMGALQRGLDDDYPWTRAASMLGLSRRASEDSQADLEPLFRAYLARSDRALQRYACLGLSKFSRLEEETFVHLVDLLGDFSLGPEVKGYVALALSSSLGAIDGSTRTRLEHVVSTLGTQPAMADASPEAIWGQEFLAELAALLELNAVSARLHQSLSDLFDDWRRSYYRAVALYEEGEAAIRSGDPELAGERLARAVRELERTSAEEPEAQQAIAFRKDIVRARATLQRCLGDWFENPAPSTLRAIPAELNEAARVYARYAQSTHSDVVAGPKRLSDRERRYLSTTRQLIDVISEVISLDAELRSAPANLRQAQVSIHNVLDILERLVDEPGGQVASSPLTLARQVQGRLSNIKDVLEDDDVPSGQRERSLRSLMTELRGLFRTSTWPLPARACPLGGLGRGSITVVTEEIRGSGTERDPLQYPEGSPVVLNVVVQIAEMAPGGATKVLVTCSVGGSDLVQLLHVVEGPARCTFILGGEVLSPVTSTLCRLELKFEARDCHQIAALEEVFIRREPQGRP